MNFVEFCQLNEDIRISLGLSCHGEYKNMSYGEI